MYNQSNSSDSQKYINIYDVMYIAKRLMYLQHHEIGFHVPHKGEDKENKVVELETALRTVLF